MGSARVNVWYQRPNKLRAEFWQNNGTPEPRRVMILDGKTVTTGPGGRVNGALEEVTKENLDAFKKTWGERYGVK